MSAEVLILDIDPDSYLGRHMDFYSSGSEQWRDESSKDVMLIIATVKVDQELIDKVVEATEYVKAFVKRVNGWLYCEQRLPIGNFTGEPGATGSGDVIIITPTHIYVIDFKYGRHRIDAFDILEPEHNDPIDGELVEQVERINLQLACYACGALERFGILFDFTHVTAIILQPFINHVSEYTCTVDELMEVREFISQKAQEGRENPVYSPSGDNCHYCRASGSCEAQTEAVLKSAMGSMPDIREPNMELGQLYRQIPLIRTWCDAIEGAVKSELKLGHQVLRDDGLSYKLVAGNNGRRAWVDEDAAEEKLLQLIPPEKHDEIYTRALRSPPQIQDAFARNRRPPKGQKPIKPVLDKKKWDDLQYLIDQRDGVLAPVIALSNDPRPAIKPDRSEFTDVEDDDDLI